MDNKDKEIISHFFHTYIWHPKISIMELIDIYEQNISDLPSLTKSFFETIKYTFKYAATYHYYDKRMNAEMMANWIRGIPEFGSQVADIINNQMITYTIYLEKGWRMSRRTY